MSNFEVDYRRTHGVHEFEMADGMPVTVLSAPTWEAYANMLVDLPDTQGYIVSPELMTSPVPLDQAANMPAQIAMRAEVVRELSRNHPYARLLLGTARFTEASKKPFNGVAAYMHGQEIGWQGKQFGVLGEWEYFEPARSQTRAFDIATHGLLICAELMRAGARGQRNSPSKGYAERAAESIPPSVRSLVVVSCWGVPSEPLGPVPDSPEERYKQALERSAEAIFSNYLIDEIIVADRAIVGHGVEPFNAHFKRA